MRSIYLIRTVFFTRSTINIFLPPWFRSSNLGVQK